MDLIKVEIIPVGVNKDNPTRYDVVAKGVIGGFCGYALSKLQAESMAEAIQLAINESYKIGRQHGLNK